MNNPKTQFCLLAIIATVGSTPPAYSGSFTTYFGEDLSDNTQQPARINSDAARDSFMNAINFGATEDFESYLFGTTPEMLMFDSVTAILDAEADGGPVQIDNMQLPGGHYAISGNNHLFSNTVAPRDFELTFSSPQAAIGFYVTDAGDIQSNSLVITLSLVGGEQQQFTIPHSQTGSLQNYGSVAYWSVVFDTDLFSAVTFGRTASDGVSYDDITIAPEPRRSADLDDDGDVDDADFGIAFAAFTGPENGPSSNPLADLDRDGDVDDADFGLAFAAFTGPNITAHVPEPTSLPAFGLYGLYLTRRRR